MRSKNRIKRFFWKVFILLSVILFVGIIVDIVQEGFYNRLSDEEKLARNQKEKQEYEKGIIKAETNEKWINIVTRLILAAIIFWLNYLYFEAFNTHTNFIDQLNEQITINEAWILGYTFIAFILAGTPSRFIKLVRNTVLNLRKRSHVGHIDIQKVDERITELEAKIRLKNN